MSHIRTLGEPRIEEPKEVLEPTQPVSEPTSVDTSEQSVNTTMHNDVKNITEMASSLKENEELLNELGITLPDLSITNTMSTANTMADLMLDAIALKAKFGKKAKGDPKDVVNMLPNRLKHIDILESAKEIEDRTSNFTASERKLITKLAKIYKLREETWPKQMEEAVNDLKQELPVEPIKEIDAKLNEAADTHTHIEEAYPHHRSINEDKVNLIPFDELKQRVSSCVTVEELNVLVTDVEEKYTGIEGGDVKTAANLIANHKAHLNSINSPIKEDVFKDVNPEDMITPKPEVVKEEPKVDVTPVTDEEIEQPVAEVEEPIKEDTDISDTELDSNDSNDSETEVEESSTQQTIQDVIDEKDPLCTTAFGRLAYVYLHYTNNSQTVTTEDIDKISEAVKACELITDEVTEQLISEAKDDVVEEPEELVDTPEEDVVEEPKNEKIREYDLLIELFGELNDTDTNMLNYGDIGMLLATIDVDSLKTLEHKLVVKQARNVYETK